MKKTILSLVGTAALLSVVSSSLALQERTPVGRKEVVERGRKKGFFTHLEARQRSEIEEYMAEDLSYVVSLTPKAILADFIEGKTVEMIIKENGLTLETAQQKIDELHKEKMRLKLALDKEQGKLSVGKFQELVRKVL